MARSEETASAEMNLFMLCRVVTEEDAVKTKDEIQGFLYDIYREPEYLR